tara:strand:+ start:2087 stop:2977 length:891 start_codon:yes stop_codon:yes gene_type:complete
MRKISIDDRMKEFYEIRDRRFLTRRTPVIIRIDGKAFHTYTKGLKKPFDEGLMEDMQLTTKYLCENIQGCKFGYVQSDEISLLITDYDTLATDAWFDYCQNKMESIAASMATAEFNRLRILRELRNELFFNYNCGSDEKPDVRISDPNFLETCLPVMAQFDARAFNIPKEEVTNYFLWRMNDSSKNSISMLAQSLYSHKELQGKNGDQMQEMCFQKGINWNSIGTSKKRGTACYKVLVEKDLTDIVPLDSLQGNPKMWYRNFGQEKPIWGIMVDAWRLDFETPIFSQNRTLIDGII